MKSFFIKQNYTLSALRQHALSLLLMLVLCKAGMAQNYNVRVEATFDTAAIRIGEQFHLNMELMLPQNARLAFPDFGDSIGQLAVVEQGKTDTLQDKENKSVIYKQSVTLTAFEPGNYILQPFYFYYRLGASKNIDSVATAPLQILVQTVPVDTAKAIKDIKPVLDVPVTFDEVLPYLLVTLALLIIVGLILWYLKKRKKPAAPAYIAPPRPAHEIANEALQKIESEKLWQEGLYKAYQSGVSDTVRTYIENRFNITALELTTDETLVHLKKLVNAEAFEKLKYILQVADTVKFAKAIPIESENVLTMEYAYIFINITKQEWAEPSANKATPGRKEHKR
ncbi:MAG: hypothetical protein H7296_01140 [Bacteroidia bacterium]|nr:hypothetical protein [Bacteroidia bacterium]